MDIYKIKIGFKTKKETSYNWDSKTIAAENFEQAVEKAKSLLNKNEFIVSVDRIGELDA